VLRIGSDRVPVVHAAIAGKATGLAFTPDGKLLLTGWDQQNVSTIFEISAQGAVETLLTIPEAMFLNGLTPLTADRYLIADSYRGAIWELDSVQRSTQIWLEHPLLARTSPDRETPAVNGLKRFGDALYASNTEKQQLIRIPLLGNHQPGEPEIWLDSVNIDDFAFDQMGNLYGTTHIYNSVVKIGSDRTVVTIAEAKQGMTGSTALAFGQGSGDSTKIYVVTNGGMSLPPPTGLEPAKVVSLDVGVEGLLLI
jgi:hypothetical protein